MWKVREGVKRAEQGISHWEKGRPMEGPSQEEASLESPKSATTDIWATMNFTGLALAIHSLHDLSWKMQFTQSLLKLWSYLCSKKCLYLNGKCIASKLLDETCMVSAFEICICICPTSVGAPTAAILDHEDLVWVLHATVTSRLDSYKALCVGMPLKTVQKLQLVKM